MPVATPFNALGAGNGFPECLTSDWDGGTVDVSHADYWTTLSGWSSVNTPDGEEAQEQSIIDSFKNAMKLFWNLYSINYTVNALSWRDGVGTSTTSLGSLRLDTQENILNGSDLNGEDNYREARPLYRVCSENYLAPLRNQVRDTETGSGVRTLCSSRYFPRPASVGPDVPLFSRMENNGVFVGYGIGSAYVPADDEFDSPAFYTGIFSTAFANTYNPQVGLELRSVAGPLADGGFYEDKIDYIELSGMHFVCRAYGFDGDTGDLELDASSGYAKVLRESKDSDDKLITRNKASVEVDSLDFYTYPPYSI